MKLGKAPPKHDDRTLHFAAYLDPELHITVPTSFGHERDVYKVPYQDWLMLGNDRYGDCVFAGAAHETILWNAEHGKPTNFTDEAVLSDYAAVTGFDPRTGANDDGTVVLDALNYRRHTGIVDAQGDRHKISAYVALEPGNWHHLLAALYLFGAVGIGIEFPNSAMAQFDRGKAWSVAPGAKNEGGHYIPLVAKRGNYLDCVTWARLQAMTKAFYTKYCDEAYAILSPEHLAGGRTLEGFDLPSLNHDLSLLRRH
jgi:hypothetical protein